MNLPRRLTTNSFAHWNFLVRGLVEVWEVAVHSGWDADLDRMLEEDEDGRLAEELGRLGNELLNLRLKNSSGAAAVRLWPAVPPSSAPTMPWLFSPRANGPLVASTNGVHH